MDKYFPPVRAWRWWVVAAVLAVAVGVVAHVGFSRRIDHRIATGRPIVGTVTRVTRLLFGSLAQWRRFTVEYDFGGRRSAQVNDAFGDGDLHVGAKVTVFVDSSHPGRVALADGLATEGLVLFLPPGIVVAGIVGLINLVGTRIRWWRRFGRIAPVEVPMLEMSATFESDEALRWTGVERTLRTAANAASAGQTGPLKLLVYLRYGAKGRPHVAWYWRKSRRLVVVVPVSVGARAPRVPADEIRDAGRLAKEWGRRHLRHADVSALTDVVEQTCVAAEAGASS